MKITMTPIEFIKKHGLEKASAELNVFQSELAVNFGWGFVDELKRIVASHALVAIHGYEKSKEIVKNAPSDDYFFSWTLGNSGVRDKTVNIGMLRKAIEDVESC